MLKYMLDTNICIFTIRNRPQQVREAFNRFHNQLCISSISLVELIYGAEKSASPEKNLPVVEGFAARLEVLPYDEPAASHTGQLRAELARSETPIGPYDQLIAGHARSRGLIALPGYGWKTGRARLKRFAMAINSPRYLRRYLLSDRRIVSVQGGEQSRVVT